MKSILVRKEILLEKLRANRGAHRAIFEEACAGYRAKAIALLDQQLQLAKDGKHFSFAAFYQLNQPADQTKDYDRAIGMLEMDTGDHTELTEQDYRHYILDDWDWKMDFLVNNSLYSAMGTKSLNEMRESRS